MDVAIDYYDRIIIPKPLVMVPQLDYSGATWRALRSTTPSRRN
jgi:hypothetical protein